MFFYFFAKLFFLKVVERHHPRLAVVLEPERVVLQKGNANDQQVGIGLQHLRVELVAAVVLQPQRNLVVLVDGAKRQRQHSLGVVGVVHRVVNFVGQADGVGARVEQDVVGIVRHRRARVRPSHRPPLKQRGLLSRNEIVVSVPLALVLHRKFVLGSAASDPVGLVNDQARLRIRVHLNLERAGRLREQSVQGGGRSVGVLAAETKDVIVARAGATLDDGDRYLAHNALRRLRVRAVAVQRVAGVQPRRDAQHFGTPRHRVLLTPVANRRAAQQNAVVFDGSHVNPLLAPGAVESNQSTGETKEAVVNSCPEGALRVQAGLNSFSNAVKQAKRQGIGSLLLESGVHDEEGEQVRIDFALKVIGQNKDDVKIRAGLEITGKTEEDVFLSDCTVTGAKKMGVCGLRGAAMHLKNVCVEKCGRHGVVVLSTLRNTMTDCDVNNNKQSGVYR